MRELQPGAVMFSDAGPDVRWVGNESGLAFETSWYGLDRAGTYPGDPDYARRYAQGRPDAADWVPPEVDVSIRPGWFYHPEEDAKVKSVDQLIDIYEASVGRGANLLLNIPPDRRGLIPDVDAERLRQFRRVLDQTYGTDLARGARSTASSVRGSSSTFAAGLTVDGRADTFWTTDDGVTQGHVELTLARDVRADRVVLQEYLPLGQRVEGWRVERNNGQVWTTVAEGTTIGHTRIVRIDPAGGRRFRVTITRARACPDPAHDRRLRFTGSLKRRYFFFSSIFAAVIQVLPSFSETAPVTVAGFSPVHTWPNFSDTSFFAM